MKTYKVGYLVGSLAKGSINRMLAKALSRIAPPGMELTEIQIKDLPLYSYDYDADFPPVARAFKQAIADVDAILFVTPEYNRSIPGALKNAIDWASRPWGKNSFARKPSALIGTSPGAIGTAVAQQQLRSVLCFCNSPLMNTMEAYIQFTPGLITEDGTVTNDSTTEFLGSYLNELHLFIERVLTVHPRCARGRTTSCRHAGQSLRQRGPSCALRRRHIRGAKQRESDATRMTAEGTPAC
jgi:chromate reductase